MALKIIWSDEAEKNLEEIAEFILQTWNEKILIQFLDKLNKSIHHIKQFPEMFPVSLKEKGVRKCVITKQVSLFYSLSKEEIVIVALFDNRQSDDKLKI